MSLCAHPSRQPRTPAVQALVYNGPGRKNLEDRAEPKVEAPTDAIVRIIRTTICGTDRHILKGDVATCQPGTVLGHEGGGRRHVRPGGRDQGLEGDHRSVELTEPWIDAISFD